MFGGLAIGLLLYFALHRPNAALAIAGATLGLGGLSFIPGLGRWVYVVWMGLGLALGRVTSPIILGVVWVALFVPMGLVFRLMGRDSMKRKFPMEDGPLWEAHVPSKDIRSYFRQF